MTAITVDRVSKRFGRGGRAVDALKDLELEVAAGEIYGLLGRNGAGKTTLVKILLDIVRASSGTATLLGRSCRTVRARRAVGYLPEDHRFPDYPTAASALRFYASLSGVDRARIDRRIPELLEIVRLSGARDRKIRTFSKGMKQRLGLAQALIHDPQLLFLDEPTDGVDPVGRAEIRDVLVDLKHGGKTIFLNSHLLSEVEQVCDRVGILDQGVLVREGTVDQLTATDLCYAIETDPALTEDRVAGLPGIVTVTSVGQGRFELGVASADAIDAVVDRLRAAGFGIRHLSSKRNTLEDVFLEAVDDHGGES